MVERAMELRELHPRSGLVADLANGADARLPRPSVEARECLTEVRAEVPPAWWRKRRLGEPSPGTGSAAGGDP
ncbi:hypothetical protein NDU88_005645 [Pleurodeles waltl]|uniref:Uncharacterized protein n=1 Tax=Pleurodeles waltl TaxID=8319 RepID=A0AAV7MF88_PLEWA|nr:hypothetical protein NDU88_005645 [Pleurodeles waltl]